MSNSQDLTQNSKLSEMGFIPNANPESVLIYNNYRKKTSRDENWNLLFFINALVSAGLHRKCTGLFYLASPNGSFNHIKHSIIGDNVLDERGLPIINSNGIQWQNNTHLWDHQKTDVSKKDLCLVFVMSKASTTGFDWGGEDEVNHVHSFSSAGNVDAENFKNVIFKWDTNKHDPAITKQDDPQEGKGVYVIHINKTSLQYRHNDVVLDKEVSHSYANFCPSLLDYHAEKDDFHYRSDGVMKLYATFSNGGLGQNGLTKDEIAQIQQIFKYYNDFL